MRSRAYLTLTVAVAVILVLTACSSSGSGREILVTAEDGLVMRGQVYGASGATGVILTHELGGNQGNWSDFAERLAGRGFLVLTFDFRGHGRSPGPREVGIADSDLAAAARVMTSPDAFGRTNFFVVGASMGGTAALKIAAREKVLGVVTLSSPINTHGLSALEDIPTIKSPKLFIVANDDQPFVNEANSMFVSASEPKQIEVLEGSDHGTDLMRGDLASETTRLIVEFLNANR